MRIFLILFFIFTFSVCNSQTKESVTAKIDRAMQFYESKKDSIKILAEQIKAESAILNLSEEGNYYNRFMGFYYEYDSKPNKAIKSYLEFLHNAEKNKSISQKYQAIGDLMNLYFNQNQISKCKALLQKAIAESAADKAKSQQVSTFYNNLGMIYGKENKPDSALLNYTESLKLKTSAQDSNGMADLRINMANLYAQTGNFQKALELNNENLAYHQKNNKTEDLWFDYNNLAQVLMKQNKYQEAKDWMLKALQISLDIKSEQKELDSYEYLANIEKGLQNWKESTYYFDKAKDLKDKLINAQNNEKIAELQEQYESEKKERINLELGQKLEEESFKKQLFELGALALLLLSGIIFYAWTKNKRKNKLISEQNDRLLDLNQEKNQIMSMVSHDLKTPFLSIRAWGNLLDKSEAGESIKQSAEHGLKLIARMLDTEKASLGATSLEFTSFILQDLLNEVVDEFKDQLKNKNINLLKNFPKENLELNSDRDMLQRAIENLLSNAIKFSYQGGKIELDTGFSDSNYVFIQVSDEGVGIPDSEQYKLFTNFANIENKITTNEQSNGLGLSIVKRIANELGGEVKFVKNIKDKTVFILKIPA